jgi:hypothetical protein
MSLISRAQAVPPAATFSMRPQLLKPLTMSLAPSE